MNVTSTLIRFNPRRAARGAEAAEVRMEFPDGDTETLWMNQRDIRANIREHGWSQGLEDALEAYKANDWFPPKETGVAI